MIDMDLNNYMEAHDSKGLYKDETMKTQDRFVVNGRALDSRMDKGSSEMVDMNKNDHMEAHHNKADMQYSGKALDMPRDNHLKTHQIGKMPFIKVANKPALHAPFKIRSNDVNRKLIRHHTVIKTPKGKGTQPIQRRYKKPAKPFILDRRHQSRLHNKPLLSARKYVAKPHFKTTHQGDGGPSFQAAFVPH